QLDADDETGGGESVNALPKRYGLIPKAARTHRIRWAGGVPYRRPFGSIADWRCGLLLTAIFQRPTRATIQSETVRRILTPTRLWKWEFRLKALKTLAAQTLKAG
ncbi:MAG: hypothetical protein ABSA41_21130, partial [Terriglobia bacterium]